MNRLAPFAVGVGVLSLLLFACAGPSDVKIDETANGTAVSLRAGQELIVTLKSNPTTGYDWQVDDLDESVMKLTTQEFKPASDPNRLGAPGQTEFQFQAAGAGTTSLRLIYVRPWEKGVEPADTFQVSITVK